MKNFKCEKLKFQKRKFGKLNLNSEEWLHKKEKQSLCQRKNSHMQYRWREYIMD